MDIDDLSELDIPSEIISAWRSSGIEQLTRLQEICFKTPALMDAKNALIIAPTSAGKTFVGEVLAVRSAHSLRRVLYVVPFKALAEEKYQQFRSRYEPIGLSVAVSSGDRDEFDNDIRNGRYLITVVVNEKLSQLLVQSPGLTSDCGLIVFDEIQLIRDSVRGPLLEMLLTRIRMSDDAPQVIGLSATVGALNGFDRWLNAIKIEETERPVPLTEYALTPDGGLFTYDQKTRRVQVAGQFTMSASTPLASVVQNLLADDKQVLVFQTQVADTEDNARALASVLPVIEQSQELFAALSELDDSEGKAALENCIPHGVAFHNGGLSLEERSVVETGFRTGQIRVLISTTTLAMGVNLPADSVIIGSYKRWDPERRGNRIIDVAEYKNCVGRAGRLSHRESGESYILADPTDFRDGLARHYLGGVPEALESAIPKSRLIEHVLAALGSHLVKTRQETEELFQNSFAAATFYRDQGLADLKLGIESAFSTLSEVALIELIDGAVNVTATGHAVARSGISVDSAVRLITFLREFRDRATEEALIFEVCLCEEVARNAPLLRPRERNTTIWASRIRSTIRKPTSGTRLQNVLSSEGLPSEAYNSALKKLALAIGWKSGEPSSKLTREFQAGLGYIRNFGEALAWLLESMAQFAVAALMPESIPNTLRRLAQEMHFGVPFDVVQFARLRVVGLGRSEVVRLVKNDKGREFRTLDSVLDASPEDFRGIINPSTVPRLQEAILQSTKESLRRHESGLLVRARRLSLPETLVKDLFESKGIEFERSVQHLLNAEQINLKAIRLAKQKRGEVYLYIPCPGGGSIVLAATASDDNAKPISWDKAREVLGMIGAPAPIKNYVVLGKPDFHDVAKDNAAELIKDKDRSILLLPVGAFGELCLRVFEGSLKPSELLEIFRTRRGYLNPAQL